MQVVCEGCQLTLDAPDGATGLVCPICRGNLRPVGAAAPALEPDRSITWAKGSFDELLAILSAQAVTARVLVFPRSGGEAAGELHVVAGGVGLARAGDQSGDEALARMRAVKDVSFTLDPRLPQPDSGDIEPPGPSSGTLEARAPAALMRYCEDYVLTATLEVWRGSENATVEYKRGEIGRVTVGGIDAPERLAEVMGWSSGQYKLSMPALVLGEAPKPRAPEPAPAAAPTVAAPTMAASAAAATAAAPAPAAATAAAAPAAAAATPVAAAPSPAPVQHNRTLFGIAPIILPTPASTTSAATSTPDAKSTMLMGSGPGAPTAEAIAAAVAANQAAAAAAGQASSSAGPAAAAPSPDRAIVTDIGSDAHDRPRTTTPGFRATSAHPTPVKAEVTAKARREAAKKAAAGAARDTRKGRARTGSGEMPLWLWIVIGLALGLGVVGAYWAIRG